MHTSPTSPSLTLCPGRYLLLAQHQHTLWFDGVIGSQVLSIATLGTILIGLPDPIPGGPGDADVVPLAIIDYEGQLGHLGRRMAHIMDSPVLPRAEDAHKSHRGTPHPTLQFLWGC